MLSEQVFSAICGPPIAANTAVSKDVGIYAHSITPSWQAKATFKKSSAPVHGLVVSDTHIFGVQDGKSAVHVYSRAKGNQELSVTFHERLKSITLVGDVVILGTADGRLILWETSTGRQVNTPPCHVQGVTCLAATPYHLLSASEDSNIHVWSLSKLLESGVSSEHEPDLTLSNHRGAVTDLVVGPSTNPETSLCVSASSDKTCILWNYQNGQVLRTLLFPAAPLCVSLDPSARALFACADDGGLYLVELFGDKPLIGSRSTEMSSIVVQVNAPLGVSDTEDGKPQCIYVGYDGTFALTGHSKGKILRWTLTDGSHPVELANLNASVTNLAAVPALSEPSPTKLVTVTKPNQSSRDTKIKVQLIGEIGEKRQSRFEYMLNSTGLPADIIESAAASLSNAQPTSDGDAELRKQNEELLAIIEAQKELQAAQRS